MVGRMDRWMDEWLGGWIDGWTGGWMDGWVGGQTEERIDRRKNGRTKTVFSSLLSLLISNTQCLPIRYVRSPLPLLDYSVNLAIT
jgi:hypothetical protein